MENKIKIPAFQLIVLGSGGGPFEDDLSGYLLKSTDIPWDKNSIIAVEAGSLLTGIRVTLEEQYRSSFIDSYCNSSNFNIKNNSSSDNKLLSKYFDTRSDFYSTQDDSNFKLNLNINSKINEKNKSNISNPNLKRKFFDDNNNLENPHLFTNSTPPFPDSIFDSLQDPVWKKALHIFKKYVGSIFVTHPHLDHCLGLTINSSAISFNATKFLYGVEHTIEGIRDRLFNYVIWPNMTDEGKFPKLGLYHIKKLTPVEENPDFTKLIPVQQTSELSNNSKNKLPQNFIETETLKLKNQKNNSKSTIKNSKNLNFPDLDLAHKTINYNNQMYIDIPNTNLSVLSFLLSHGRFMKSTAYFFKSNTKGDNILIFGDFEADSVSKKQYNFKVWQHAAYLIAENKLNTILMECSYPGPRKATELYGHLSPQYVIEELLVLQKLINNYSNVKSKDQKGDLSDKSIASPSSSFHNLQNLNIFLIHIKYDDPKIDPRSLILSQLDELKKSNKLECTFSTIHRGQNFLL